MLTRVQDRGSVTNSFTRNSFRLQSARGFIAYCALRQTKGMTFRQKKLHYHRSSLSTRFVPAIPAASPDNPLHFSKGIPRSALITVREREGRMLSRRDYLDRPLDPGMCVRNIH